MQVFALHIFSAGRNDSLSVYTLFIKEVADAHSKCIRNLMQPSDGDVSPSVYPIIYCLSGRINTTAQLRIAYIFFIITRRRFNCEGYCFSFIL